MQFSKKFQRVKDDGDYSGALSPQGLFFFYVFESLRFNSNISLFSPDSLCTSFVVKIEIAWLVAAFDSIQQNIALENEG